MKCPSPFQLLRFLLIAGLFICMLPGQIRANSVPAPDDHALNGPTACVITLQNVPADATIACEDIPGLSNPVTISANADCCVPITLATTLDTLPGGPCPEVMVVVRTWTATDACGNTQTAQQSLSIQDLTAPIFTLVPPNVTVECDVVPVPPAPGAGIQAEDGCGGVVTITLSESQTPGICPQQYTLHRVWTAADQCGNTASAQQQIQVRDTQAPQFINPPVDITIACGEVPGPAPDLEIIDNCAASIEKTYTETMTGGGDCDLTFIVRTWTTEDQCGNSDTHIQTITRGDTGGPVFDDLPPFITVECDEVSSNPPGVTDDCDPSPEIDLNETLIPGNCPGNYTLVRTWTATDACGHETTAGQTLVVEDTTPPVISFVNPTLSALANGDTLKVLCQATETFDASDATVVDGCDANPTVIFIDSLIFDDGCKKLLYCAWEATDHCQNTSSFVFYMLVGDFTGPILQNVPANLTISCDQPIPPAGTPSATDDCDLGPKISFQEITVPGPCPQSYHIVRTWTATDNCGNSVSRSQTISVVDQVPPVLTPNHPAITGKPSGSTIIVECGSEPVFTTNSVTGTDNCDQQVQISLGQVTKPANCLTEGYRREITYTWTGTDDCGNQSTWYVHVRVIDTTDPVFTSIPTDVTLECGDPLPTTSPTASDNCDGPLTITHTDIEQPLACGYLVSRTWVATDSCGNSTSAIQQIRFEDKTPPVLGMVPADISILCDDLVPTPPTVQATDICDPSPTVSLEETIIPGDCEGNYDIVRTWTATDDCGNTATKSQTIHLEDHTPPVFTKVPPDASVSCDMVPSGDNQAMAEDNCANQVIITWKDDIVQGSCANAYFLVRTFTADDGCGNTSVHYQKLSVFDHTPPVFEPFPSDLTIACDQVNDLPEPIVTDNCDPDVSLTHIAVPGTPGNCPSEYTLLVTWTAEDNCGNSSTATQSFLVVDPTPPVITPLHPAIANKPSGSLIIVECDSVPVMDEEDILVEDNCDPNPKVTFSELLHPADCNIDGYLYQLTCTWTAMDTCGNVSEFVVYVRVVDTTPPVIKNVPADVTIEVKNGETIPGPANVTATDACDPTPTLLLDETTETAECGYYLIRTWTATDQCGNQSTAQQKLFIDEGCPCQKPHVDVIHKKDPKYGVSNGMVTIDLIEDEANYSYLWIPNKGKPNAIGNSRSELGPGNYQVFISDPKSSASCFIKLNISLTMQWSCIDTIYATIAKDDPTEICVESVLDLNAPVAAASVCGFDPQDIESVTVDPQGSCVVIDPVQDFVGTSTICVVHCDASQPPVCDTTYIIITINAVIDPPCDEIFQQDLWSSTITDCNGTASVCLPVNPDDLGQYYLTLDGLPYAKTPDGCDLSDAFVYTLSLIPGNGEQGPYTLNEWSVNGQTYSGSFQDLKELLILLQDWHPEGHWRINSANTRLYGGPEAVSAGTLIITQNSTGTVIDLLAIQMPMPNGSVFELGEGEHLLVITNDMTGCSDETILSVTCLPEESELIAVDDKFQTTRNQSILLNLIGNDVIPGGIIEDLYIQNWPKNGTATLLLDNQVRYTPDEDFCSLDSFQYVICNETGCDTATVCVEVLCSELMIYNGFSPNGDGVNDHFLIDGIEAFPENKLTIWNRWGNLIFSANGYKNQWGGTWEGSDLPDGTYFYILEDGTGHTYRGYVQINR